MSPTTVESLDRFWELIDEVLNAVLFVLIGLEVLVMTFTGKLLLAGVLLIPVVLLARLASAGLPVAVLGRWFRFEPGTVRVLTWGGLRGGISVALALSIPSSVPGARRSSRSPTSSSSSRSWCRASRSGRSRAAGCPGTWPTILDHKRSSYCSSCTTNRVSRS